MKPSLTKFAVVRCVVLDSHSRSLDKSPNFDARVDIPRTPLNAVAPEKFHFEKYRIAEVPELGSWNPELFKTFQKFPEYSYKVPEIDSYKVPEV